jgi:hypothetical protein
VLKAAWQIQTTITSPAQSSSLVALFAIGGFDYRDQRSNSIARFVVIARFPLEKHISADCASLPGAGVRCC